MKPLKYIEGSFVIDRFKQFCINQHDVVCNQKYDDTLPYSFHLNAVAAMGLKYSYLLNSADEVLITQCICWGHDLIEDARVTYNDIDTKTYLKNIRSNQSLIIKEGIFACTELRGRNRDERKSKEYFDLLKTNRLFVFCKLCDILANVTYGVLTNSSMVGKYRKEYSHLEKELFMVELKDMFIDLKTTLNIGYDSKN